MRSRYAILTVYFQARGTNKAETKLLGSERMRANKEDREFWNWVFPASTESKLDGVHGGKNARSGLVSSRHSFFPVIHTAPCEVSPFYYFHDLAHFGDRQKIPALASDNVYY